MKIILVAGARPNFMKIAPMIKELKAHSSKLKANKILAYVLVHTGQHYDYEMSQAFFEELEIPGKNWGHIFICHLLSLQVLRMGSCLESCRLFLNHEGIEPRSHLSACGHAQAGEEHKERLLCPAG